jgi:hypothetical protein
MDYKALRSLTAREMIAALNRDGFVFTRQRGCINATVTLTVGV